MKLQNFHNRKQFCEFSVMSRLPWCYFKTIFLLLPLILGKTSMPDTVDSVVTCNVFLKLDCDSLKWYLWKWGIITTGLRKQCLFRLSTYVDNISTELKAVRQAYSRRSQRPKKSKWWWKRRGSQRKGLCTVSMCYCITVPVGQLWWIVDKKEKDGKERSHNYITQGQAYMDVARPSAQGKGKTLHIDHNNGSPTNFSLRYHEKNRTVYLKFEIKLKLTVKTCCLVIKETVNPLIQ